MNSEHRRSAAVPSRSNVRLRDKAWRFRSGPRFETCCSLRQPHFVALSEAVLSFESLVVLLSARKEFRA
jgi:hypothetical protein